jgi:hypothetical protein
MSVELKRIKGSCHTKQQQPVDHAEISLTQFYNGRERGMNIQVTINNAYYGTSYIHLNEAQCQELAEALKNSFNIL